MPLHGIARKAIMRNQLGGSMSFSAEKITSIILGLVLLALVGCGGGEPPPSSSDASKTSQLDAKGTLGQGTEETSPTSVSPTNTPVSRGVVLANRELGMTVSGQGSGAPARSVEVLERQVVTLLPDVREVYERERAQDPGLMGSLDVTMTIEPNGEVSDLRFPVKRVSNERLTAAVFEALRAWTFPPDNLPVQLRFTMLFVPPGIDEASILLWEKRLGSRPVIEKVGEEPLPAVAAVSPSQNQLSEERLKPQPSGPLTSLDKKHEDREKRPTSASAAPSQKSGTPGRMVSGWYRVLQPTVLRAEPSISSRAVAGLQKGLRVRVVRTVKGQWLEVHSVNNRPPGFLRVEDAAPERAEQAERR